MAWSDAVRTVDADVSIWEDIARTSQVRYYPQNRILSIDITEEAPCVLLARRISECTVRVTNDFKTNSDGWRGPAMSAVAVEDPAAMVGQFMSVYLSCGYGQRFMFVIDSVEATDDGASIHGLGLDSLLDKSFAEVGASSEVTTSTLCMTWSLSLMAACGYVRSSIIYPTGYNSHCPRAYDFGEGASIREALVGLQTWKGLVVGLTSDGKGAVGEPSSSGGVLPGSWSALGWPEPFMTDRVGTLVVKDPSTGTEQEVVLDATLSGRSEVSAPFTSDIADMGMVQTWARRRLAEQWYSVEVTGDAALNSMNNARAAGELVVVPCSAGGTVATYIDAGGVEQWVRIRALRVEHIYDGGFRQRLYGPIYTA